MHLFVIYMALMMRNVLIHCHPCPDSRPRLSVSMNIDNSQKWRMINTLHCCHLIGVWCVWYQRHFILLSLHQIKATHMHPPTHPPTDAPACVHVCVHVHVSEIFLRNTHTQKYYNFTIVIQTRILGLHIIVTLPTCENVFGSMSIHWKYPSMYTWLV